MLMPSIFGENLFDDWFDFPTFRDMQNIDRKLYGKHAAHEMKTDVHEHEDHYVVDMDLPGFKKDDINLTLENGTLTVTATKGMTEEEKNEKGKLILQERFAGTMQRSFYIGDYVTEEDIRASLDSGVLHLTVPKKEAKKAPEKHQILIEG